jgi:hypothetical protein
LTTATNASIDIIQPYLNELIIADVYLKGAAGGLGKTYEIYSTAFGNGTAANIVVATGVISANGGSIRFLDKITTSAFTYNVNAGSHAWAVRKTGTDNVTQMRVIGRVRPANELEIAAYNAGWRP